MTYKVVGVDDEHTCASCRRVHGKKVSDDTAQIFSIAIAHHCENDAGCRCALAHLLKREQLSDDESEYGRMQRLHPVRMRWERFKLAVSEWWHS